MQRFEEESAPTETQVNIGNETIESEEEYIFHKVRSLWERSKYLGKAAVIGAELLPLNELGRYGALTYALANTDGGPLIGGAVLGATTFLIEGGAAYVSADVVTSERATSMYEKINEKVEKVFPDNIKMNPASEAGVAMIGGSVVTMTMKQREDISRNAVNARKHGVLTAAWMSAYFTAEGAWIGLNSEGGDINARTIGAALLAFGLSWGGGTALFKKFGKKEGK